MPRRKKNSRVLEKAEQRSSSLKSISPTLDLGNGLTLSLYSNLIEDLRSKVAAYNTALSHLDKLSLDVAETELQMRDLSEKMLLGVGAKYGKSSQQYGMAGGTPKNKRRRSTTHSVDSKTELSRPQSSSSIDDQASVA
ncbi:hypothetical protein [Phormidesmis priestleyi]